MLKILKNGKLLIQIHTLLNSDRTTSRNSESWNNGLISKGRNYVHENTKFNGMGMM